MKEKNHEKGKEVEEIGIKKSVDKGSEAAGAEYKADVVCKDKKCPFHGKLATRGRSFKGYVTQLREKRVVVEFERFIFIKKYERYARKKTRIHAHLSDCLVSKVRVGSYVKVMECRPLSNLIHHVVVGVEK